MRLQILAFHVKQIATEPVGSKFTLCPCPDVKVEIEICESAAGCNAPDYVKINGRYAGNRSGGIQEFIRIVDKAQPEIEFDYSDELAKRLSLS